MPNITFMGAAGTVTGAKFLVSTNRARVLVDCGLFQGLKELRLMNWETPSFDYRSLDSIVLTHAHMDHTGYLPKLAQMDVECPVHATRATVDLCGILLPDSAHLQEEQAEHANQHNYSKHSPALPLYTGADARRALEFLRPCNYGDTIGVAEGIRVRFSDAGHILGSAIIEMWVEEDGKETKIVFSGDLGRYGEPLLGDPTPIPEADYLLVESTYGDRSHSDADPEKQLAAAVSRVVKTGGCLLIPSFSVGRTQQLLYAFDHLEGRGEIPSLPIYVDSPMAIDATSIFMAHPEAHRLELRKLENNGENPLKPKQLQFVRSSQDSEELDTMTAGPMILISASGMATGGRILHHLEAYLTDPKSTVLFVGYQAEGTRGRSLLDGDKQLKMHGHQVRVKANIQQIDGYSAHADRGEIMRWLSGFKKAPATTFLVHGEPKATRGLSDTIQSQLGWATRIPALHETSTL